MRHAKIKTQIEIALHPLINTRLSDIGRAHTLEWMIFIPMSTIEYEREDHSLIEYCLNIQCTWRITDQRGIVIASDDLFFPAGDNPYNDMDNFDWAVQGNSRLDARTDIFTTKLSNNPLIVLSIKADPFGGLKILLTEGYSIELFPSNSIGHEFWRFFVHHSTDDHFVVTGKGIGEPSV